MSQLLAPRLLASSFTFASRGSASPERFLVGIATSGRAAILADTLADLDRQTHPAAQIVVAYGRPDDIRDLPERFPHVRFLRGAAGLCAKRNLILEEAGDADFLFYMDDDFYLHPQYLETLAEAFRRDPRIVAATGIVLADGAKGPGLTFRDAQAAIGGYVPLPGNSTPHPVFNTYGCNMGFRLDAIREHGLRFDENLPAYGWYEDIDFSRRLACFGEVVKLGNAAGVHLGAKVGRVSGLRLGYSQVANPIYLSRKGSFPWNNTVRSVGRNAVANLLRSIRPEPYVDRRGRLRGNLLAFRDLVRGTLHPGRIDTL